MSFSVAVTAESDVSYQWLRDGAVIAGATQSSFGLASASLLDTGATFSVRITNQVGSTTSQGARLTVVAPAFTLLAGVMGDANVPPPFPPVELDGVGSNARFISTGLMAVDGAGNIYVAGDRTIRKVTPDGTVTTFVGKAGQSGRRDGTGSAAGIYAISALAFDRVRNVLVFLELSAGTADPQCSPNFPAFCPTPIAYLREATLDGVVTTRQSLSGARSYEGIAIGPDATVYVTGGNAIDNISFNPPAPSAIYKLVPGGDPVPVAGNPDLRGDKDGNASEALFSRIWRIASDAKGNLYIVDRTRLRKLSSDGIVTTLAGRTESASPVDGKGAAAAFSSINSLAVDGAGNALVADNNLVRRVSPEGSVSTIAQSVPPVFPQLQGVAVGSGAAIYVGGYFYIGRFAPIPG